MSSSGEINKGPTIVGRDLHEASIDDLARLASSGNSSAFALLAVRLRPKLLIVLRKRLHGKEADAEDVTQITLAKAWAHIGRYDVTKPFMAWICTIAFRSATDYQRKQLRQEQHVRDSATPVASKPPSRDSQAAEHNIWATAKRVLTSQQYAALWLRYGEDLTVEEVAETIGKTRVATRVLLCRARGRLRKES